MDIKEKTAEIVHAKGFKKFLYQFLGWLFLGLGIIGIILPIMPHVIFFILSAAFFMKSSQKMYDWLTTNKYFGKYIKDYQVHNGMTLMSKIVSISALWISIIVSSIFFAKLWYLRLILILIAAAVTIHLVRLNTIKKEI